jgi:Protein of unknown function (DUF2442)
LFAVVTKVRALEDLALEIIWEDGTASTVSLRETVAKGGVFASLSDPQIFGKVTIGEGGRWLQWPGDVDICADYLWYQSHPEAKIEELDLVEDLARRPS